MSKNHDDGGARDDGGTRDDDGGVQDDDGGAGDNNDVELSQWACDFPSFGKKRCFEANTL